MAARRAVSVRDNSVVKLQDPAASRRERLRTLAGRDVGLRSGLFVVPDVLSFDDDRGEITFERLHLTWLREAMSTSGRSLELAGRAGAALAAIHGQMCPPAVMPPGTAEAHVGGGGRAVPLHGDYGMRNVFYLADTDRLAIIDWSNADWIGVEGDVGPPEADVAVFLMSLFHRRVFGPWPIARLHDVARQFLATYAAASPCGLDTDGLRQLVAARTPFFHRQTQRRKGRLRAVGYRHNLYDLCFFLHRLSGEELARGVHR
jgi:aminoglycoside/choline kinase family phosphotransferase